VQTTHAAAGANHGRKSWEEEDTAVVVVVVVVVVTFFNHNFVNCEATLILAIRNLLNEMQYKPE